MYTSMNDCQHKYCNDCWKAHLQTQIQLGCTDLKCPGHNCPVGVDDITLMSLLPSLHCEHATKRLNALLEVNPQWKWCPADRCKLVAKVTTPKDCEHVGKVQSFLMICACGTIWCFKCSQDVHWPATCEQAHVFREKKRLC